VPVDARVGDLGPNENSLAGTWQVAFLGEVEPRAARPGRQPRRVMPSRPPRATAVKSCRWPPLSHDGAFFRPWNFEPALNCRRPMAGRLNCTFTPQLTAWGPRQRPHPPNRGPFNHRDGNWPILPVVGVRNPAFRPPPESKRGLRLACTGNPLKIFFETEYKSQTRYLL